MDYILEQTNKYVQSSLENTQLVLESEQRVDFIYYPPMTKKCYVYMNENTVHYKSFMLRDVSDEQLNIINEKLIGFFKGNVTLYESMYQIENALTNNIINKSPKDIALKYKTNS